MAEGQRSEAAYQRVCAELGKVYGEMVAAQTASAEKDAIIADLRHQLVAAQDQLQQQAGEEGVT